MLDSWNDTSTRAVIEEYVRAVTGDGPGFVPEAERIATFDNDGTLWAEKPMPIQLDFTLHRMAEMAKSDEALQRQQPWKAAFEKDMKWLGDAMVKQKLRLPQAHEFPVDPCLHPLAWCRLEILSRRHGNGRVIRFRDDRLPEGMLRTPFSSGGQAHDFIPLYGIDHYHFRDHRLAAG